jgi:phosphoribosylaminoimidazole (AIR) synthetase
MTVIVRPDDADQARHELTQSGESVAIIGNIAAGTGQVALRG